MQQQAIPAQHAARKVVQMNERAALCRREGADDLKRGPLLARTQHGTPGYGVEA
jgi:hypothetical protein